MDFAPKRATRSSAGRSTTKRPKPPAKPPWRAATPLSDNEYKVQLAKVAVKRALLLAAGLETGGF